MQGTDFDRQNPHYIKKKNILGSMTHILVSSVLGRQIDPWGLLAESAQPKQRASDQQQINDHNNSKKYGGQ